ncbi:hypothetical protein YB2330_004648 [Saitoella coloradoensis]
MFTLSLAFLALSTPLCHAWGSEAHTTVGLIAQSFLLPRTQTFILSLLDSRYDGSIGAAAPWADEYRNTAEGRYSGAYHYIDTLDDPPNTCGVDLDRDCPSSHGCIVSAIANYTQRLGDESLGKDEQNKALKFLVHFLGDITQPLHASGHARGGNEVKVTFAGKHRNLHGIWDDDIPQYLLRSKYSDSVAFWTQSLVDRINANILLTPKEEWTTCVDPDQAVRCATEWATDSNKYDCSYVYSALNDTSADLSGEYYRNAVDIVELQVAKGGLRLAAWLNSVVTGEHGLSKDHGDRFVLQHPEL